MHPSMSPAQAWQALREGNVRFVTGTRAHPHQDADRRVELTRGQNPFAIVFGCSDSRVAAEIVFDRGLGDLFVVRTAGHVVDSGVLGSLEFGVTMLGSPLVVVLGHDHCGAVTATLAAHRQGTVPGGYVRDIIERIGPSLITARHDPDDPRDELDQIITEHVRHTGEFILERSTAIAGRVRSGECAIAGVTYSLDEGRARLVSSLGAVG
ncbi:MAG: carbonic anhydrase [Actinomycetota bacterium]|nr:carbonic anhydrase [Actinomycetota bacterium]